MQDVPKNPRKQFQEARSESTGSGPAPLCSGQLSGAPQFVGYQVLIQRWFDAPAYEQTMPATSASLLAYLMHWHERPRVDAKPSFALAMTAVSTALNGGLPFR